MQKPDDLYSSSRPYESKPDPFSVASTAEKRFEALTPLEDTADFPSEQEESASDKEASNALWSEDTGTLPLTLRRVLVTLLKGPYLYREKRKDTWDLLVNNLPVIRTQLANLLLELVIDDEVGVAYIRTPDLGDTQAPSLLNTYKFKFLDSVLLIEMRDRLMRAQQSGQRAAIELDEITSYLSVFEPLSKTDSALFANRVNAVLKRMKERHLLLDLGQNGSAWEISPVLKVLFDAAQIDQLRTAYEKAAHRKRIAEDKVASTDQDDFTSETQPDEDSL